MIQPQSVRDKKCAMSGSGFNIAMIRSERDAGEAESGIVGDISTDLYVYGQPARRLSSFDQNHEPCVSRAAWPAHLSLLFAESDSGSEPGHPYATKPQRNFRIEIATGQVTVPSHPSHTRQRVM